METKKLSGIKMPKKLVAIGGAISVGLSLLPTLVGCTPEENTFDNGTSNPGGNWQHQERVVNTMQVAVTLREPRNGNENGGNTVLQGTPLPTTQMSELYYSPENGWRINFEWWPHFQNNVDNLDIQFTGAVPTALRDLTTTTPVTIKIQGYHEFKEAPTSIVHVPGRGSYYIDGDRIAVVVSKADEAEIGRKFQTALDGVSGLSQTEATAKADVHNGAHLGEYARNNFDFLNDLDFNQLHLLYSNLRIVEANKSGDLIDSGATPWRADVYVRTGSGQPGKNTNVGSGAIIAYHQGDLPKLDDTVFYDIRNIEDSTLNMRTMSIQNPILARGLSSKGKNYRAHLGYSDFNNPSTQDVRGNFFDDDFDKWISPVWSEQKLKAYGFPEALAETIKHFRLSDGKTPAHVAEHAQEQEVNALVNGSRRIIARDVTVRHRDFDGGERSATYFNNNNGVKMSTNLSTYADADCVTGVSDKQKGAKADLWVGMNVFNRLHSGGVARVRDSGFPVLGGANPTTARLNICPEKLRNILTGSIDSTNRVIVSDTTWNSQGQFSVFEVSLPENFTPEQCPPEMQN